MFVRILEPQATRLRQICKAHGVVQTRLVATALERYLDAQFGRYLEPAEPPPPPAPQPDPENVLAVPPAPSAPQIFELVDRDGSVWYRLDEVVTLLGILHHEVTEQLDDEDMKTLFADTFVTPLGLSTASSIAKRRGIDTAPLDRALKKLGIEL